MMNTNEPASMNTKRISLIERLITGAPPAGLGYCCLWAFFTRNKRTEMIAIRLGVSSRAIRLYKARHGEGEFSCGDCTNCLKRIVNNR